MTDKCVFQWKYKPENYFEEPVLFKTSYGEILLENGSAKLELDIDKFNGDYGIRYTLNEELKIRLDAVLVLSHRPYELSEATICRVNDDGQNEYHLFLHDVVQMNCIDHLDLIVHDENGNIISDTKRDRIEKRKTFSELMFRHKDNAVVKAITNSYASSVYDKKNELIYLYEIRDALCRKFGNEDNIRTSLEISRPMLSSFRKLANDAPINQGRHRGLKYENLRSATEEELENARSTARLMIEKYLLYLEEKLLASNHD